MSLTGPVIFKLMPSIYRWFIAQDYRYSSALAMELLQSCDKPSIWPILGKLICKHTYVEFIYYRQLIYHVVLLGHIFLQSNHLLTLPSYKSMREYWNKKVWDVSMLLWELRPIIITVTSGDCNGISNHQKLYNLFNSLFRKTWKSFMTLHYQLFGKESSCHWWIPLTKG